jgi:uncharacterized protein (UPF0548 family)
LFTFRRPSAEQLRSILEQNRDAVFSYSYVGCSRSELLPSGYNIDHREIRLGAGQATFGAAKLALRKWKMFEMDWLRLFPKDAEIRAGALVAVVPSHLGFSSINLCRVVYVDESEFSYAFAYGTLGEHAEMGEERFTVSWNREDDSVSYEILAFSKPRAVLARIGYPFGRALQRRFAEASLIAMADQFPSGGKIL